MDGIVGIVRKFNSLLRFYFNISDIKKLSNEEYFELIEDLFYALDFDGKRLRTREDIGL